MASYNYGCINSKLSKITGFHSTGTPSEYDNIVLQEHFKKEKERERERKEKSAEYNIAIQEHFKKERERERERERKEKSAEYDKKLSTNANTQITKAIKKAISVDPEIILTSTNENFDINVLKKGIIINKLKGHTEKIKNLVISQDGSIAVSNSFWEDVIRVWDIKNCTHLFEIKNFKFTNCLAISSESGKLVIGKNNFLHVFDISRNGVENEFILPHDSNIVCVTISRDNKNIITITQKKYIRIWDSEALIIKKFYN